MHGYQESFNPYRVFKFVATSTTKHGLMQKYPVSIPIGFSSSLQLQFEIDNALYVVFTSSRTIIKQLEKYSDKLPFLAKVVKIGKSYSLS